MTVPPMVRSLFARKSKRAPASVFVWMLNRELLSKLMLIGVPLSRMPWLMIFTRPRL